MEFKEKKKVTIIKVKIRMFAAIDWKWRKCWDVGQMVTELAVNGALTKMESGGVSRGTLKPYHS